MNTIFIFTAALCVWLNYTCIAATCESWRDETITGRAFFVSLVIGTALIAALNIAMTLNNLGA
jgi:hypothetical protein